ncbi:hypothetical protein BD413DRAFT_47649 [Trametes elegans]|nr:hypothetical protein BD413DRAFT_47649 [Trametes elegans]
MAHRCVRKLRLATCSSYVPARHFQSIPASRLDALAVPFALFSTVASTSTITPPERPLDAIRRQRAEELRGLLSLKSPSPHRVWANYLELVQYYGSSPVPRDIHQGVLRKCAIPAAHVRAVAAKMRREGGKFKDEALYESRYREVIRNIRATGSAPALEDYHCVLELFAALGNYRSAMLVLDEISTVGLVKNPETYSLCLQALSHRLTLPIWHLNRPMLVDEVTEHCVKILNEMSVNNTPYTSVNVDLAFRILKETMNMQGFTVLMKGAYGIDLAYPDRSPLELWENKAADHPEDNVHEDLARRLPSRLPLSLATFNTALDFLGRAGDVSKMVQTFEVLTNPLPSPASNRSFDDDDDDDDDFGFSNPQVAPYSPPHIRPNTTSFHVLLRWLHHMEDAVLARHYLLVALEMERQQGRQLRGLVRTKPPHEIPAPRLAITRNLLLPVFSIANDNKRTELLRWVLQKAHKVVRRKQYDIRYFEEVRARWIDEGVYRPPQMTEAQLEDSQYQLPLGPSTSRFSSFFDPSSSLHASKDDPLSSQQATSSPTPPEPSENSKPFDIDVHLNLLRRDARELAQFTLHIDDVYARTVQRIKERLGRRVWAEKNIYLRDIDRRIKVPKEYWRRTVNFRPRSELVAQRAPSPQRRSRPSSEAGEPRAAAIPSSQEATVIPEHLQASSASTESASKSSRES